MLRGTTGKTDIKFAQIAINRSKKSRASKKLKAGKNQEHSKKKEKVKPRRPEAYKLYLKAYQVILQNQCDWLINSKGLPAELELLVKALWSLRLQVLTSEAENSANTLSSEPQMSSFQAIHNSGPLASKTKNKVSIIYETPGLLQTLGLCYLGLLLLRLPISIGDIHKWAIEEEIPYIRAIRFISTEAKGMLPIRFLHALKTADHLGIGRLHHEIRDLIFFYSSKFKMSFPVINSTLISFKYTKELALPITVFAMIPRLASLLNYQFEYPPFKPNTPISSLPEPRLISLLIVVVKLIFPFDDIPRTPYSFEEPGALKLDWGVWREAQKETEGNNKWKRMNEDDVFKMSGEDMDAYLDWSEKRDIKRGTDKNEDQNIPQEILDMFPTTRAPNQTRTKIQPSPPIASSSPLDSLTKVLDSLTLNSPHARSSCSRHINRPGSGYQLYRSKSDLPNSAAEAFYNKAAEVSGLKVEKLMVAVLQIERKLIARMERRGKGCSVQDIEDDDDDDDSENSYNNDYDNGYDDDDNNDDDNDNDDDAE
ncbi:MAG: Pol I core factor CF [Cirrosporium novae-zelandiae]|nr:MAG: Pol I core factor CF [Cirrosporium novae-zelandiae]